MKTRYILSMALSVAAGLALGSPAYCAEATASLNPLKAVGKAKLKAFLERPLFDPTRQLPPVVPPQPIAVAPPFVAPPDPPPTLHLLGVIQGERSIAVVRREGGEKTLILRTGDRVGDWQVTVLPSVGIRLENGSRVADYAMFAKTTGHSQTVVANGNAHGETTDQSDTVAARDARLRSRTY